MPSPNAKDANVAIAIRPIQLNFMRFLCPCGVPLVFASRDPRNLSRERVPKSFAYCRSCRRFMPLSAESKTAFPKNEDLSLPLDGWDRGKSPGKAQYGCVWRSALPYTEGHMDNLSPEAATGITGGASFAGWWIEG